MDRFAANDAAERHDRVIGTACLLRSLEADGRCSRNFQRARHRDHFVRDARLLQFCYRSLQQRVLDVVIEARFDDEAVRARDIGLILQRSTTWIGHLLFASWFKGVAGVLVLPWRESKGRGALDS